MLTKRCKIGDQVRCYGFPGVFVIAAPSRHYDWLVRRIDGSGEMSTLDASIVEINGHVVPMLSLPIAPPASDYPHSVTLLNPPAAEREYALCRTVERDPRFAVLSGELPR